MKNQGKLIIDQEKLKELNLKDGTQLKIDFSPNHPANLAVIRKYFFTDSSTWRWFLLPSLIMSLLFSGYFYSKHKYLIALSGINSIASWTIIVGTGCGSVLFCVLYLKNRQQIQQWLGKKLYWRSLLTINISFAVILGIALLAFFWLLGIIFKGTSFDLGTASFIFLLFNIVTNFAMFYAVETLSPDSIFKLLITVIISGALVSMITNSNKHWWLYNISYLGTTYASNSWQFNLTLIVSSLLFLALTDFLFSSLEERYPHDHRLLVLRILLTLFAVSLGGVGIFANNAGLLHRLHTDAAALMIRVLIIIVLSVSFLLPESPKRFRQLSYITAGILVISTLLFQVVGYLSLTAYELIDFILVFGWLILLLQQLQQLTGTTDNSLQVRVFSRKY